MNELDALLEVERISREIVAELCDTMNNLHGECDTECKGEQECEKTTTVAAVCPKCGEKFGNS